MPVKKPTPSPAKPRFQVVEHILHYITEDGDEVRMPLNLRLPVLRRALAVDGVQDVEPMMDLLTDLLGADADKLGVLDLMPLFDRWTTELGRLFAGVSLGESEGSSKSSTDIEQP